MIKGIGSGSPWLNVFSPPNNIAYGNMTNGVDGQVRYNTSTQQYEIFANGIWNQTGSFASVDPSERMIQILEWAESKMHMEREVMELLAKNPTVADSYNNYKQAESQLKMVMTLVKDNSVA
jgi:hypothetical protein